MVLPPLRVATRLVYAVEENRPSDPVVGAPGHFDESRQLAGRAVAADAIIDRLAPRAIERPVQKARNRVVSRRQDRVRRRPAKEGHLRRPGTERPVAKSGRVRGVVAAQNRRR